MYKKYKNFIWFFTILTFFSSFVVLFIICFVDPFRLYHKATFCPKQVYKHEDMRYNAKYFIDNMDYDSLIFGSSMLENTSAKEASDKLGGKFINISIRGSHFDDRKIIMDYIFKHKKIKSILSTLDISILPFLHGFNRDKSYWEMLYDDNLLNDIKVYNTNEHIKYIFDIFKDMILGNEILCNDRNFDMPAEFINNSKAILGNIKKWKEHDNNLKNVDDALKNLKSGLITPNTLDETILTLVKNRLYKDLLSQIKENKDVNFILFIPPYFTLSNAIMVQTNPAANLIQKEIIRFILEQKLPNLKLFAFDFMNFTNDIANYIDTEHYGAHINSAILDFIAKDIGLLKLENFDDYWQAYEQKARNFDLFKFRQGL